jgi:HK97 family phage major capsid protein/HK97 family phage prohead protease
MTVVTKPTPGEVEQRSAPETELTIEGNRLHGLIPYGVESRDLGGWTETIEPGALSGVDMADLVCTLNHDASRLLGRFDSTLTVESRSDGLAWSCELPTGPTGQDVRESVQRGDLRESSWRMVVGRDRWDGTRRHIEEIRSLRDVAVVTTGAYPADSTRVELREHPNRLSPIGDTTPASEPAKPQEEEVKPDREKPRGGGLTVEDRAAPATADTETRILDAMRSVPKGEARDLTHATIGSEPIEPPDVATYLWDRLREPSVLLSTGIPIISTDRKKFTWPTLIGDIQVGFVGELEEIPKDDPELDEFALEPKAIKGLTLGSTEAFEDSADPALMQIVQDSMLASMALKFDGEGILGGSAKGFPGMLKWSGRQKLDAKEALLDSYDAIIAGVGLLLAANVPPPFVTLMHPRLATHFDRLRQQGVVAGEEGAELVQVNSTLARPDSLPPSYTSSQLPIKSASGKPDTSSILIYAPAQLACVRRREATIEVDRSREFDIDGVLVRGRARAVLGTEHEEAVVEIANVATPAIEL